MASIEVRDPVHGLVDLQEKEWAVVNTAAFQRLRGVQQLAMTHLVYPGARHSRFEHCMGASHVAGRLAERVNRMSDYSARVDDVRLAALVHDIGHGPFSHVSEEVFEQLTGDEHVHEKISAAIVRYDPQVRKALGTHTSDWIADLLEGQGHGRQRSVERDIVAGPADIDKLDYLLRDSMYCGVNYGRYDLAKIVESARAIDQGGAESYLAYHEDAIYALEEMLLARFHMHRQVYGHKTRMGIDRMLVRAMRLGVEESQLDGDVFKPPAEKNAAFVRSYVRWDDALVTKTLCAGPDSSPASQTMRALVERRLCKRIMRLDFNQLRSHFNIPLAGYIAQPDDIALQTSLGAVEQKIATAAGIDPCWVILHWEDRKSPLSLRYSFKLAANGILLVDDEGNTTAFHERSEVFTTGEPKTSVYISLYVRGPKDKELSSSKLKKVEKELYEGLEVIGTASASI